MLPKHQKVIDSQDHSYRAPGAKIRIHVPEGYESPFGEIDPATIETDLDLEYIRGRGNSTWDEVKKPFKFKLNKGKDLFAMGSNKHWVLLANAFDGSKTVTLTVKVK